MIVTCNILYPYTKSAVLSGGGGAIASDLDFAALSIKPKPKTNAPASTGTGQSLNEISINMQQKVLL
jgi:hypothetical protein